MNNNIELNFLGQRESNINNTTKLNLVSSNVVKKYDLLCDLNMFLINCENLFGNHDAMASVCKLITSENFLAKRGFSNWIFPITINRTQVYAWVIVFMYALKEPVNVYKDSSVNYSVQTFNGI